MSAAALALQQTGAMRSIKMLSENARLASQVIEKTQPFMDARAAIERSTLAYFPEAEALQAIRRYSESNQFARLALQESEAMKSLRAAAESTRIFAMSFLDSPAYKQLQDIAKSNQSASMAIKQSEAFNHVAEISKLASFKALYSLENSPLSENAEFVFPRDLGEVDVSGSSLIEIDTEISEEISSNSDFNALSEKTKKILLYLYHYYFLPLLLGCLSAYMMSNAGEARKELQSVSTPSEVRSFVRASHREFEISSLKGFRITTAHALNLREEPSMKGEIVTILPIGTLAEVIDKSRRSWILVEVEVDGVLEQGWISRRYTTYFK